MPRSSSKDKAEFRKAMAAKGYSRIPVYAPTNAKDLREEILALTKKMVEDYEAEHGSAEKSEA